jgi:hypothetical protein
MSASLPGPRSGLGDFVLGYLQQAGAIVEPPAYGVYDVLLPEEAAARLGVAPFQRLAFDEQAAAGTGPRPAHELTFLHYGHPLVEKIVGEVRQQPASGRLYLNTVRLDKRGLADLAGKTLSFPNARLFAVAKTEERAALYHYVRFNFKASLITDEVRELILPVWMHVQGGYALEEEEGQHLIPLEAAPAFATLPEEPPARRPEEPPLAPAVLAELLERARETALERLAAPLEALQARVSRFLELDQARLGQYYDDLQRDLEKRRQSAAEERQDTLKAKQVAVELERQAKLADAEEKYRLRVTLELINLLVVVQPKIVLPMQVKNRTATVTRPVVWDPLRHRLEALVCDACGRPSSSLWLCSGGHLAHSTCLLPQCVDCKRVYCRLCSDQMTTCVVCERPLCRPSVNRCPSCGRGTCREHVGLCHAAAGEPQRILPAAPPLPEVAPVRPGLEPAKAAPEPALQEEQKPPPSPPVKAVPASKRARKTKESGPKRAPAVREIEVYAEMEPPRVTAYAIVSRRTIAIRTWELTEEGLAVSCLCEKGPFCRENRLLLRPESVATIEGQIWREIRRFREEYEVPEPRMSVYRVVHGRPQFTHRLMLLGRWKDREALARVQAAYDRR